jgi:hypothetical protein
LCLFSHVKKESQIGQKPQKSPFVPLFQRGKSGLFYWKKLVGARCVQPLLSSLRKREGGRGFPVVGSNRLGKPSQMDKQVRMFFPWRRRELPASKPLHHSHTRRNPETPLIKIQRAFQPHSGESGVIDMPPLISYNPISKGALLRINAKERDKFG